ncbi:phage portal protein [Sphingobium xenophagum]|uniref:Phage portal protein n=1 Tax=Sphingobium xenophagum TaxID=121428 RepID=A0A249MUF4_SPHXE|nr:phage portal protein [Sphingobium xenophagum]ASY44991.1 phage portal protein [Sphingobium xenophagum]
MPKFIDRLLGRGGKEGVDAGKAKPVRQRIRTAQRAEYDGATVGRRAAGWRRTRLDANGELTPATQMALRGIARDLDRNNPWATSGANKIAEHIVGTGITFQVYRNGVVDAVLNDLARKHFDTTNCDAAGRHDLYGIQLQAARTIVVSGSVLLRRRWRRKSDRLPLPMQLQLLEPDYIDGSRHGPMAASPGTTAGYYVHGIQFSPLGRREGYWLYNTHPGSTRPSDSTSTYVLDRDVAHVFRADRPEQEHGATWFAPVILRLKDFGDYEDAQLTRQKIASAFAGFVSGDDDGQFPGIGNDGDGGEYPADREPLDFVESGTVQYLRPGEEITFPSPPTVDGYMDYSRVSHLAIAAGLGVPVEILTGDLSKVSFISGRLGRLTFKRSVDTWQWLMFIRQFCASVERWFIEAAEMEGHDVTGVSMRWTPPKHEMLDPASEVPANRDAVRSGQKTHSQVIRENGDDPDTFFAELAADMKRLDDLGIILDSDPRRVTQVGNSVQIPNADQRNPAK